MTTGIDFVEAAAQIRTVIFNGIFRYRFIEQANGRCLFSRLQLFDIQIDSR